MANAPGWEKLLAGNYTQAVATPHTTILGEYFWAVLIASGLTILYMKTDNFVATMVTGMLVSSSIAVLLPGPGYRLFGLAVLFGMAVAVYKLFK